MIAPSLSPEEKLGLIHDEDYHVRYSKAPPLPDRLLIFEGLWSTLKAVLEPSPANYTIVSVVFYC